MDLWRVQTRMATRVGRSEILREDGCPGFLPMSPLSAFAARLLSNLASFYLPNAHSIENSRDKIWATSSIVADARIIIYVGSAWIAKRPIRVRP
jgi:hypothetical protein